MERANISQLKNHLSRYLRAVRAGESVLVLDRGRPVARISPVRAGEAPDAGEAILERLEREGALRRACDAPPTDLLAEPPPRTGRSVLDALVEERRDGR